MTYFKSTFLTILTLVLISACTTLPDSSSALKVKSATELSQWTARGKILLVSGKEKESAYFYWRQDRDDFQFTLSTFIGVDVLSLKYENGIATLKLDGKSYSDNDPQRLVARLTNKQIPFKKLPLWLLGSAVKKDVIDPIYINKTELQSFAFKESGFNKQTWRINYSEREPVLKLRLPKGMTIKSSDSRIKIAISNWQLEG
ncbi:lipoprotein insertase outer membrane protein LolB [Psychrosphaera aestuarii]|uniref:lipoprotein insertase outer membrane protein LolB n=1 Tax=Psychrosphaera aestuarii TaxID=1266052 RepID=UPI001B31C6F6|nr:lipoprotein insertase outer membrane protein LolB [Psychrosphaera aestuarii]